MWLCLPASSGIPPRRWGLRRRVRRKRRLYRLLSEQDERVLDFAAADAKLQRFVGSARFINRLRMAYWRTFTRGVCGSGMR